VLNQRAGRSGSTLSASCEPSLPCPPSLLTRCLELHHASCASSTGVFQLSPGTLSKIRNRPALDLVIASRRIVDYPPSCGPDVCLLTNCCHYLSLGPFTTQVQCYSNVLFIIVESCFVASPARTTQSPIDGQGGTGIRAVRLATPSASHGSIQVFCEQALRISCH